MEKQALDMTGKDKSCCTLSEAPLLLCADHEFGSNFLEAHVYNQYRPTLPVLLPRRLSSKELPSNAGDTGDVSWIPGWGRSPGGGNGNLLQYSCLGNPTDRRTWKATVHGVIKSWTQLSN